jgi:acetolactate synthase I/II/III large subunit
MTCGLAGATWVNGASAASQCDDGREANDLTSGPNGYMGVGVPFAFGAAVTAPHRPPFVIMGDGGFGWHGMESDTLIRHPSPMVGIVFNNAGFTGRPAAKVLGAFASSTRRR